MRTTWVLFRKEMKEHLRTFRLLAVVGVLGVFGLATPVLLAYLPEILALSGDTGAMPIEFPDFTAADAVKSYLDTVGQIGLLTTILVAMGTIAQERERGTAALVLSKPVGTGAFVLAGLEPGPIVLRVEPLDDGDGNSFIDGTRIDLDFRVAFSTRAIFVPRGGNVPDVTIEVVAK